MSTTNKLIVVADSTQIAKYSECPMSWHYGMRENLIPAAASFSDNERETDSIRMDAKSMGSFGHKILELYYLKSKIKEDPHKAFGYAANYKEWINSVSDLEQSNLIDCINKLGSKNIIHIIERLRLYTMMYQNDFIPDRLEVGFSYKLYEDERYLFILEGRIDFLGSINYTQNLFMDHKLQTTRKSLYEKSIQFRNYALVSGNLFGVINYIRMASKVDDQTFKRQPISFSKMEIDSWKYELIDIYNEMAKSLEIQSGGGAYIERKAFPRRRSACPGRFNYTCVYTSLCDEPNEELVKIKKSTMFTKGTPWKPWHEGE